MDGATNLIQVFQLYNGGTWLFVLFLAAGAYLLFRKGGAHRFYAVCAILAACLVFNDAVYWLFEKVLGGAQTYYRFLWMIPVVPVLSYAAVDAVVMREKKRQRFLAALAVILAVILAGDPYLDASSVQRPSSVQYLNVDAAEVCDRINEDRQNAYPDLESVKVAAPIDLMMSLRLQDASYKNGVTREIYLYDGEQPLKQGFERRQRLLQRITQGKKIAPKRISRLLKKANVQYVIISNQYDREKRMLEAGCAVVARTYHYTIYRAKQ